MTPRQLRTLAEFIEAGIAESIDGWPKMLRDHATAIENSVLTAPQISPCWLCGRPKGQGPDRCAGHYYDNATKRINGPMTCQTCSGPMIAEVDLTGGCRCSDQYCYCDSPDASIQFYCGDVKCNSNRRFGDARYIKPVGLRDQYGIARWFTENYKEQ